MTPKILSLSLKMFEEFSIKLLLKREGGNKLQKGIDIIECHEQSARHRSCLRI